MRLSYTRVRSFSTNRYNVYLFNVILIAAYLHYQRSFANGKFERRTNTICDDINERNYYY
jgi:hypothetical protein